MAISDRGVHPDLLEEELQAAQAPPQTVPPTRRRRGRSEPAAPPDGLTQADDAAAPPADVPAGDGLEDVLQKIKESSDPKEMLGHLTKFLPKDDLARDTVLAGYIGDRVQHGIRDRLAQQEKERQERERQEAYQRGDLYTLGQLSATDYAAQEEALKRQSELAVSPMMAAIKRWQDRLPQEVQQEVASRTYAPNGSFEDGLLEYLEAVKEAAVRHGFDEEIKKREPALRKAYLSETVGSESTPEREGGRVGSSREITDEQIGTMSLEEYNEHFDEKGRPRNGITVRYTRAIDPRTVQR